MNLRALILIAVSTVAAADTPTVATDTIVAKYTAASQAPARAARMDVDIAASLPQLKKQGKLHALRRISSIGRVTYEKLRFEGDGAVKSQVIVRYLTAEAETQKDQSPSLAVTPDNYKFRYKALSTLDGRPTHVFQVTPRKKRTGLFQGELWIDAVTFLPVQESGYLVKNPSIFVKKIAFVRKFEIRGGISVPLQVQSVVDTRLVGRAELIIDFSNYSVDITDAEGQ